ncbi:MAG TPA: hypothetical protein VKZ76_04270 [Edaphocola sp.]|nr:hypothetical protein [Edaphocola sp.]
MNTSPNPPFQPQRRKSKKFDNAALGLISGLLFSFIGLVLVYFTFYRAGDLNYFIGMFTEMKPSGDYAAKYISLAMICNLAPFYFFLNRKAYQGTKGVIMATALMGVVFVLYKFVW